MPRTNKPIALATGLVLAGLAVPVATAGATALPSFVPASPADVVTAGIAGDRITGGLTTVAPSVAVEADVVAAEAPVTIGSGSAVLAAAGIVTAAAGSTYLLRRRRSRGAGDPDAIVHERAVA
ncbi:hypothetical protein [Litorihabitans aurantiacus]|uniref:LPXTG-motif cell wall anchor domain-containing protein n=1 Tax=Litorihabitans aurantiacus TaxID=1930061 RepID=A0AA37UGU4_9MICO|nr:hypothetical protein [Litorihabitans aurantiacus]GMA30378.1 hypothetical protein GCM10025875_03700 [Litorihabitans aurantiacus]